MRTPWVWATCLIVIAGLVYVYLQHSRSTTASVGPATSHVYVRYDGTSFSPSTVTVAKGGTVTFIAMKGTMWIASDPHPNHEGYDGVPQFKHCANDYLGPA